MRMAAVNSPSTYERPAQTGTDGPVEERVCDHAKKVHAVKSCLLNVRKEVNYGGGIPACRDATMERAGNNLPISVRRGSPGTRRVAAVSQTGGLRAGLWMADLRSAGWQGRSRRAGIATTGRDGSGKLFPARSKWGSVILGGRVEIAADASMHQQRHGSSTACATAQAPGVWQDNKHRPPRRGPGAGRAQCPSRSCGYWERRRGSRP
jgi:hypothetical protein